MSSDSFCVAWYSKKSKDKMKELPRMCGYQTATISASNKKGEKKKSTRSRNWAIGTSPVTLDSEEIL